MSDKTRTQKKCRTRKLLEYFFLATDNYSTKSLKLMYIFLSLIKKKKCIYFLVKKKKMARDLAGALMNHLFFSFSPTKNPHNKLKTHKTINNWILRKYCQKTVFLCLHLPSFLYEMCLLLLATYVGTFSDAFWYSAIKLWCNPDTVPVRIGESQIKNSNQNC